MKPHPRIRKAVKWGGAAVTVLLVVVWVGSRNFCLDLRFRSYNRVQITCGCLYIYLAPSEPTLPAALPPAEAGCEVISWSFPRGVRWEFGRTAYIVYFGGTPPTALFPIAGFQLPLWAFFGPSLLASAAGWRFDALAGRRARGGLCPKCHYDRTGLPGGSGAKCPECGAACG